MTKIDNQLKKLAQAINNNDVIAPFTSIVISICAFLIGLVVIIMLAVAVIIMLPAIFIDLLLTKIRRLIWRK